MDNAEPTITVTVKPYFIDNNNREIPYNENDIYYKNDNDNVNEIVEVGKDGVIGLLVKQLGNIVEPGVGNKIILIINPLDDEEADDENIPNHYNDWLNFIPTLSIGGFEGGLTLKFAIVAVEGVEFAGNAQQAGRYSRRRRHSRRSYKRHTHKRRRQLRRKSAKRTRTRRRT